MKETRPLLRAAALASPPPTPGFSRAPFHLFPSPQSLSPGICYPIAGVRRTRNAVSSPPARPFYNIMPSDRAGDLRSALATSTRLATEVDAVLGRYEAGLSRVLETVQPTVERTQVRE